MAQTWACARAGLKLQKKMNAAVVGTLHLIQMLLRFSRPCLHFKVVIVDDADGSGAVASRGCLEKLFGSEAERGDGVGYSVAADDVVGVAAAGAPAARGAAGEAEGGAAYVLRRSGGAWEVEHLLRPPRGNWANASADDDGGGGGGGGEEDEEDDDGGGGYTAALGGVGRGGRVQWGRRARARFGESVAVSHTYGAPGRNLGRAVVSVAVGAPGVAKVGQHSVPPPPLSRAPHGGAPKNPPMCTARAPLPPPGNPPPSHTPLAQVFVYDYNASHANGGAAQSGWLHSATLTHPEAVYAQHRFGGRGALAMDQDLVVVGAPGLECVFAFRRVWDRAAAAWAWAPGIKLVSSDYDYDYILERPYMHTQHFGVSAALSKRTVAVGAPFADYGNRGSTALRESFPTDGLHNTGVGRGAAYLFYSVCVGGGESR